MQSATQPAVDLSTLQAQFGFVRSESQRLCAPLVIEDYQLQSMPDCSPPKWHLAHSTWFFETFVLKTFVPDYRPFHDRFNFLFNSYYDAIGDRWPRAARGLLSRPTVDEVYEYRRTVDEQMISLLESVDEESLPALRDLVELGLNHEQQHQELLLTDIKHAFGLNPLRPVYRPGELAIDGPARNRTWEIHEAGVRTIGHRSAAFAFDNEGPEHQVFVNRFQIASDLVTNGEYLEFMADRGYERPEFWLSDGWATRQRLGWTAPLYWEGGGRDWSLFTLRGMKELAHDEPVCHLSYYEADAFARWAGARLPTEFEWETASRPKPLSGNLLASGRLHPSPQNRAFYGDVWVWTASPYSAYPGYRQAKGAIGEYNGKFMCNQIVLRGGSCVTPADHLRPTYRNFFPPDARWQFSGLRLAKDDH